MKRFFIFLAVLMAFCWTVPAQAEFADMWADVYKWTGGYNADGSRQVTKLTSGVQYQVLSYGTTTLETLYVYNSNAFTSYTNPVTSTYFDAVDRIQFRVDPTDSTTDRYVDLIVVDTSGGYTAYVKGFDKYTHAVIIDERVGVDHVGTAWFVSANSSVNTHSTGISLLAGTLLKDFALAQVSKTTGDVSFGNPTAQTAYTSNLPMYTATDVYVTTSSATKGVYISTQTTLYYTCTTNATYGTTNRGYFYYWFNVLR